MTKPSNFILNSDYSTLKNDDSAEYSFTITGSKVIAASPPYSFIQTETFDVGASLGATQRVQIETSLEPDKWYSGSALQYIANGTYSASGPTQYPTQMVVYRTSSTQVTVLVLIANQGGPFGAGSLTTEATTRTVRIRVATFIPPFS
jgi:hypothetical protein